MSIAFYDPTNRYQSRQKISVVQTMKSTARDILNMVTQGRKEHLFPGCAVGYCKKGEWGTITFGTTTYDTDSPAVTSATLYDLASITKSIPTSCLALKLIEENKLSLNDTIISYLPEFRNRYREQATIFHLLTHTLYYGPSFTLSQHKDKTPSQILQTIYDAELSKPPGTDHYYTNINSVLLGIIIEKLSGKSLDRLATELFFQPLSMNRTTFTPKQFPLDEIAPSEYDPWRGRIIQGEVHDESAYRLSQEKFVGSAGLFSTVDDLMIFLAMLLEKGVYHGKRFFQEQTIEWMHSNQLVVLGKDASLGWELNQSYMGHYRTTTTFGKTGFTGCVMMLDIAKQSGLVILSNHTFPRRRPDKSARNEFYEKTADIIFC